MFQGCSNIKHVLLDEFGVAGSNESGRDGYLYVTHGFPRLKTGNRMFYYCTSLEDFTSSLYYLVDGSDMFNGCHSLTTFNSDLGYLESASFMFTGCNLNSESISNIAFTISDKNINSPRIDLGINTSIVSDSKVKKDIGLIKYKGWDVYVNGSSSTSQYTLPKYAGCTTVNEIQTKDSNYTTNDIINGVWTEHLPDLINGSRLFEFVGLDSFTGDLSKLTNGERMFYHSYASSFTSNLPSLTNGGQMFQGNRIEELTLDMPNLNIADDMFHASENLVNVKANFPLLDSGARMFMGSPNLKSFEGDLSHISNASQMFYNCTSLTSVNFNNCHLGYLNNASAMFYGCNLDETSVGNIAESLPTVTSGNISLGVDLSNVYATRAVVKPTIGYPWYENEWQLGQFIPLLQTIVDKGWTVELNGKSLTDWTYNPSDPT